jgi:hydrogenase maturation protease
MKTLVIGLGNPILGDDGVGWKVAEEVKARIGNRPSSIEVDFASLGGLSLMERVLGYDRVILIDSMQTGHTAVGNVSVFALADLEDPTAGHSASTHDTSLKTALEAARTMGLATPSRADVVAIEIRTTYDFSEALSPAVERAVRIAVQKVMDLLQQEVA